MWAMQLLTVGALRLDGSSVALGPILAPQPTFESAVAAGVADETADSLDDQEKAADEPAVDLFGGDEKERPATMDANDIDEVTEGTPEHVPLEGRDDPSPDVEEAIMESIPTAPEPNMSAQLDLVACNCDCCTAIEREEKTLNTNWTCSPATMVNPKKVSCDLTGIPTCNAGEPFDYTLFCHTHCRPVATEVHSQCMALSSGQLDNAHKDGEWKDPLVPAIQELPPGARADAMGGEPEEAPPTSSPREREVVAKQKAVVDDLWSESGPVQSVQTSLRNAKRVA